MRNNSDWRSQIKHTRTERVKNPPVHSDLMLCYYYYYYFYLIVVFHFLYSKSLFLPRDDFSFSFLKCNCDFLSHNSDFFFLQFLEKSELWDVNSQLWEKKSEMYDKKLQIALFIFLYFVILWQEKKRQN